MESLFGTSSSNIQLTVLPHVRTARLVAEAQNSQSSWTGNGLDGTSFELPVDETATAARQQLV